MAERGGRRVPRNPASYSGVGKNSRRTDQPLRSPRIQESTDLPQGAREQILQGQRVAPLSRTRTPEVVAPSRPIPAQGLGGMAEPIPDLLFQMDSKHPNQPVTAGSPFGPGPGPEVLGPIDAPDDRQLILQFLARGGNQQAQRILSGLLEEQRPADLPAPDESGIGDGLEEPVGVPLEDELLEDVEEEEELEEFPTQPPVTELPEQEVLP